MKRLIVLLTALCAFATAATAQDWAKARLDAAAAG